MDYTLLELGPATSLVTNVLVTKWGSDILVSCIYDPLGSRRPYQLLFNDCREVRWEVIHPEDVEDVEADLIGFSMGAAGPQGAALSQTDLFVLRVLYGSLTVEKDW